MPSGIYQHSKFQGFYGHHHILEAKECMRNAHKKIIGEQRYNWKGAKVSYRGLHYWVWRMLGKPVKCEFCGKEKDTPKSIHWANKSGRYLRDLSDWIQLCMRCHKWYDVTLIK